MTLPQTGFILFALLLGTGLYLALTYPKRKRNVRRNSPEHLRAMARYHSKMHENDSRN